MSATRISRRTIRRRSGFAALIGVALVVSVGLVIARSADGATTPPVSGYVPPVKHVFVINIENKGYDTTWGPTSAAPYLAKTLRSKGVLLNTYYGTAHNSQPNYIAQLSGQGPNPQMQADCQIYSSFVGGTTAPLGQAVGTGCVFPSSVPSLPTQLDAKGLTWKGYLQDMGTPCRHPAINTGTTRSSTSARSRTQLNARSATSICLSCRRI